MTAAGPCADCGFDPAVGSRADHRATVRHAGDFAGFRLGDLADDSLELEVTSVLRELASTLGASVDQPASITQLIAMLAELGSSVAAQLQDDEAARLAHVVTHGLSAASCLRRDRPKPRDGEVAALHVGSGGVPKFPVEHVTIGRSGLEGDRQGNRKHHGRPFQAVCLWSAEVIEALAADGHPVGFGCAGENVTVRGTDWASVLPGQRLRVGDALLEVTSYAIPCAANNQWFADNDSSRLHHRHGTGLSRLYASVVEPGAVSTGDPVLPI